MKSQAKKEGNQFAKKQNSLLQMRKDCLKKKKQIKKIQESYEALKNR